MTLMDAPKFDAVRSHKRMVWIRGVLLSLLVFLVGMWFFTGRPVDWPWTWWTYWAGERDVNQFLQAVEGKDLNRAYAIWFNDFDWSQHPDKFKQYPFDRFSKDWGADSMDNEYGTIASHRVIARKLAGTDLVIASFINGRKSKPLYVAYNKNDHTLSFYPYELTLGDQ